MAKQIQIHLVEDGGAMPSAIDVEVLVNGVSSTSVTVSAEDLKAAVANYASKAGEIALDYQRAGALIDAYYPKMTREIVIRSMIRSKIWI